MKRKLILVGIGLSFCLLYGAWHYEKTHPETDNATIKKHIIPIASLLTAPVEKVWVQNNTPVHTGQLLLSLDSTPFQAQLKAATAHLTLTKHTLQSHLEKIQAAHSAYKALQASASLAQTTLARQTALFRKKLIATATFEAFKTKYNAAHAKAKAAHNQWKALEKQFGSQASQNALLLEARAAVEKAEWQLKQASIHAPCDGVVTQLTLQPGASVYASQPLLAIVASKPVWIEANFKETQLPYIRSGQRATIDIDMVPHHTFEGKVTHVSPGTGSAFSLFPPENASGQWIKVVQRVPVRIDFVTPPAIALRTGASATVRLHP